MKPEQFDVIAEMLRMRKSVRDAIRSVLIDGVSPATAAEAAAMSPQSVSNALKRFRDAHAKVADAFSLR